MDSLAIICSWLNLFHWYLYSNALPNHFEATADTLSFHPVSSANTACVLSSVNLFL